MWWAAKSCGVAWRNLATWYGEFLTPHPLGSARQQILVGRATRWPDVVSERGLGLGHLRRPPANIACPLNASHSASTQSPSGMTPLSDSHSQSCPSAWNQHHFCEKANTLMQCFENTSPCLREIQPFTPCSTSCRPVRVCLESILLPYQRFRSRRWPSAPDDDHFVNSCDLAHSQHASWSNCDIGRCVTVLSILSSILTLLFAHATQLLCHGEHHLAKNLYHFVHVQVLQPREPSMANWAVDSPSTAPPVSFVPTWIGFPEFRPRHKIPPDLCLRNLDLHLKPTVSRVLVFVHDHRVFVGVPHSSLLPCRSYDDHRTSPLLVFSHTLSPRQCPTFPHVAHQLVFSRVLTNFHDSSALHGFVRALFRLLRSSHSSSLKIREILEPSRRWQFFASHAVLHTTPHACLTCHRHCRSVLADRPKCLPHRRLWHRSLHFRPHSQALPAPLVLLILELPHIAWLQPARTRLRTAYTVRSRYWLTDSSFNFMCFREVNSEHRLEAVRHHRS